MIEVFQIYPQPPVLYPLGNFVNLSSTEVHVVVGGTANITCSYPIYRDHTLPLISINNGSYVSIDELPQSRYNDTVVPNSNGDLCTLTLFYHHVTVSDNGTSYRFFLFIGSSRETESDTVRLYVHKPEDPPNSQCRLCVPLVHVCMYTRMCVSS